MDSGEVVFDLAVEAAEFTPSRPFIPALRALLDASLKNDALRALEARADLTFHRIDRYRKWIPLTGRGGA